MGGVQLPADIESRYAATGLAGAIPPSFGDLGPSLTEVYLFVNSLTSLPSAIGALTGLKRLELGSNAITSLPTEIGALTALTLLALSVNQITALPSEITALTNLDDLYLQFNQLTAVPTEFKVFNAALDGCSLAFNSDLDCASVRYDTSCCGDSACGDTSACYNPAPCTYADTTCALGARCPGGTLVSAACADRSAYSENPCACTALEQLAALSTTLQATAPWEYLESTAYCQTGSLVVLCESIGGVELPTAVGGSAMGLAGAMPPSVGDLGPQVTYLSLNTDGLTAVPSEIAALSLEVLDLRANALTGLPTEFRTVDPSVRCDLGGNGPGFSCVNVGSSTSCCTEANCGDTSACHTA